MKLYSKCEYSYNLLVLINIYSCPFDDLGYIILFWIYLQPELRKAAQKKFKISTEDLENMNSFASWCITIDDIYSLQNGLELIAWWWIEYHNGGKNLK